MNLPDLNDGFFIPPPKATVPVFSLARLEDRIRNLALAGLHEPARELARAVVAVCVAPGRLPPGFFAEADFSQMAVGGFQVSGGGMNFQQA